MLKRIGCAITVLLTLALLSSPAQAADTQKTVKPSKKIEGVWKGTVQGPDGESDMSMGVVLDKDKGYTVRISSEDYGIKDMLVENFSFNAGKVHFEVGSESGYFEGKLKADGLTIEGSWLEGSGGLIPIVLKRVESAPAPVK